MPAWALALLALLAGVGAGSGQSREAQLVRGKVETELADGGRVAAAHLRVALKPAGKPFPAFPADGRETLTDSRGLFYFDSVPFGSYVIEVSRAAGAAAPSARFAVTVSEAPYQDLPRLLLPAAQAPGPATGRVAFHPVSVSFDPVSKRLYAVAEEDNRLYEVSAEGGFRSLGVLAPSGTVRAHGLVRDGDRLWVATLSYGQEGSAGMRPTFLLLTSILPRTESAAATANRMFMSQGRVRSLTYDAGKKRLLLVDPGQRALLQVGLRDGRLDASPRDLFSHSRLKSPTAVAVEGSDRLLVGDSAAETVFRATLSSRSVRELATGVGRVNALALCPDGKRLWVSATSEPRVLEVALETGAVRPILDRSSGLVEPWDVACDADGRAWVADHGAGALFTLGPDDRPRRYAP